VTGISTVATVASDVGILGVGLEIEQQNSVKTSKYKQQVCLTFNSVVQDAYREVKSDITNVTGCMCVGRACCSMSKRRRRKQFRGVTALHLCVI